MLFPSLSAWNMVKDATKHISDNMIGYAQTPHNIHEDSNINILPEVLITMNRMVQDRY